MNLNKLPRAGDIICDCWYIHQKIEAVHPNGRTVRLADGQIHSTQYCCEPADHPEHPDMPELPTDMIRLCVHTREHWPW